MRTKGYLPWYHLNSLFDTAHSPRTFIRSRANGRSRAVLITHLGFLQQFSAVTSRFLGTVDASSLWRSFSFSR